MFRVLIRWVVPFPIQVWIWKRYFGCNWETFYQDADVRVVIVARALCCEKGG